MEADGAPVVRTVILVTPSRDESDPAWAFVARHVEAMGAVADEVLVVTPDDAALLVPAERGTSSTRRFLEATLQSRDEAVVVVVDDPSLLAEVRSAVGDAAPVLWWSSQVPASRSVAAGARWADGMVVLAPHEGGTSGVPTWIVGAGIDLVREPPDLPNRTPLQILALGRIAPSKGLTTVIRAVAIARGNGIDTRLHIVGAATNAVELQYRQALEALVRDVALSSVVTIHDPVLPDQVGAVIASSHALIDASVDDDLRRAPLEALAMGRPVLTSNRRLASFIPSSDPTPAFDPGDPAELAKQIDLLAELWPTSVTTVADGAHTDMLRAHERSKLPEQWAIALTSVQALVTSRRAEAGEGAAAATDAGPERSGEPELAHQPLTDEIPLEPARTVSRFFDAWSRRDAEGALSSCAPGALRCGTAATGSREGVPAAEHLYWATRSADGLVSTLEALDVIDGHTVVTVRRDHWTIAGEEVVVTVRSLFELEDDLIANWWDTELRPAPASTRGVVPSPEPTAVPVVIPDEGAAPPVSATRLPTSAAAAPPSVTADAVTLSPTEQLERAEEQIHHWRRQAVIWRERALEARALGEAYRSNVDDLRVIIEVLRRQGVQPPAVPPGADPAWEHRGGTADDYDATAVDWDAHGGWNGADPAADDERFIQWTSEPRTAGAESAPVAADPTDAAPPTTDTGPSPRSSTPEPATGPVAADPTDAAPPTTDTEPGPRSSTPEPATTRSGRPPSTHTSKPETLLERSARKARQFARSWSSR